MDIRYCSVLLLVTNHTNASRNVPPRNRATPVPLCTYVFRSFRWLKERHWCRHRYRWKTFGFSFIIHRYGIGRGTPIAPLLDFSSHFAATLNDCKVSLNFKVDEISHQQSYCALRHFAYLVTVGWGCRLLYWIADNISPIAELSWYI